MTERRAVLGGSAFEERTGYARAVVDGDWAHVSGTTGYDYATMTISEDVVEQAEQCLRNIGAASAEAGCGFGGCGAGAVPAARAGGLRAVPAGVAAGVR